MHEPENRGKGLTAIPTVEGNLLLGPSTRTMHLPFATTKEGLDFVRAMTAQILPQVETGDVIRSFSGVRPNPYRVIWKDGVYVPDGNRIGSFCIENPGAGFWSLIGIKTPGLTCANELGNLMANAAASYLNAVKNPDFSPYRKAIQHVRSLDFSQRAELIQKNSDYGKIICWCEEISKAEILEAIQRGAVTVDGVKRRTGAMMGRCQGSRCQQKITALLAQQLGISPYAVIKDGEKSYILEGRSNESV